MNFSIAGTSRADVNNRIVQGGMVIRQTNLVLSNNKVTRDTKTAIYTTIVESIVIYGSEVWVLNEYQKLRLKALEMDYWRICRVSRLEHIRNEENQM